MTTMNADSIQAQIGEAAGSVWRALNDHGPMSMAKLTRLTKLQRDTAAMAVGWLAREDKVSIEDTPRSRIIALR